MPTQSNNQKPVEDIFDHANQLLPELASIHAINPFFIYNAPARSVMMSGHFSQRPVLEDSELPINQTGVLHELGKYTFDVKMPEDGVIIRKINRYDQNGVLGFNPETIVIYRSTETGQYGMFSIPYYESKSTTFGYRLKMQPAAKAITPGTRINRGTVFARSPSVHNESDYAFSLNANVAIASHRNSTLDGFVVNEDILKRFKTRIFENRIISFGANSFPLNINGEPGGAYMPIPEIGSYTREDGLLMVTRRLDDVFAPATMSITDVCEVDYRFDTKVYGRQQRGRVVDVKVFRSNIINYNLPEEMTQQLYKYHKELVYFYQQLVDLENQLLAETRRMDRLAVLDLSPELHSLITYARAMTNQPNRQSPQSLQYTHRLEPIDAWRVSLTIEYEITPHRGHKFSCMHGGN